MAVRKGMVLAAGKGTRLGPLTRDRPKAFVPVDDQLLAGYALAVLMRAGIRDLLVVLAPEWREQGERLFGDGSRWGVRIEIGVQEGAGGLPHAIAAGSAWLGEDAVAVILGDNLFHGSLGAFHEALDLTSGAHMFAVPSPAPERFGVVEMDAEGTVLAIEEKPARPRSNLAVLGLYVFDGSVARRAAGLQASVRGETEMIDLLESYRMEGRLRCSVFGPDLTWLDAGTPDALQQASRFAAEVREETGGGMADLDQIANDQGWV